jgi:antitoxin MazE
MTSSTQTKKPPGHHLGLHSPVTNRKAVGLQSDQYPKISMKDKSVVTTPCDPKPLSLEERLARFDPARHGGEVMNTDNPLNTEKW